MFEHFGLKDAFLALWKYKLVIFCITVLFTIIGGCVFGFVSTRETPTQLGVGIMQDTEQDVTLYEKTTDFYLDYNGTDNSLSSKSLASMYLNTFTKLKCNEYVSDYILSRMSKEDIINRLHADYSPEDIHEDYFEQFVVRTVDSATGQNVTLSVRSIDQEYSTLVVEAYMSWVEQLSQEQNSHVSIVSLSESLDIINVPPAEKKTISEKTGVPIGKAIFVFAVVTFSLCCIIAMGICLFRPVMNRKNDFEELGITVLGEVKVRGKRLDI